MNPHGHPDYKTTAELGILTWYSTHVLIKYFSPFPWLEPVKTEDRNAMRNHGDNYTNEANIAYLSYDSFTGAVFKTFNLAEAALHWSIYPGLPLPARPCRQFMKTLKFPTCTKIIV